MIKLGISIYQSGIQMIHRNMIYAWIQFVLFHNRPNLPLFNTGFNSNSLANCKSGRTFFEKLIHSHLLREKFVFASIVTISLCAGCDERRFVYLPNVPQPPPAADAPAEIRLKNWIGVDQDGDQGGSCAHASSRNVFRAAGEYELDAIWFQKSGVGYEGPESADRLLEKYNREGILFVATEDGDVGVLESATRTGRWAVIFYYPSHSITFCGFYLVDGVECALLLDNNFPDRYIVVEKRLFLKSWQELYGGFAVLPWINPIVPRTFPRTYRS